MSEPRLDKAGAGSTAPSGGAATGAADAAAIARLQQTARLLDSSIRLPGGFRIGVDGLIGLIPGIGDLAGAAISGWLIWQAARLGVPGAVLARMVGNVGLETLIGSIPVVGDLFDFAFKANMRNYRLLERYHRAA